MDTLNNDPNFSIVLPGGCNAGCSFCFARPSIKPLEMGKYLANLEKALVSLPSQFYQISITGGEPLISPYLIPVLGVISKYRHKYTNVLVTTNGTHLIQHVGAFKNIVDHINVSRHHHNEAENNKIFGGNYNVRLIDCLKAIEAFEGVGIDISVNCVINDTTDKQFIDSFISISKLTGFQAIRFRKENGNNDPVPVEDKYSKYPVVWQGGCPVCKTRKRIISGMDVFWKTSVIEPNKVSNGKIFEIVYAPNGKCYSDWEYLCEVKLPKATIIPTKININVTQKVTINPCHPVPNFSRRHIKCNIRG